MTAPSPTAPARPARSADSVSSANSASWSRSGHGARVPAGTRLAERSARQRGFTLAELMAVVAIMSILAAIGMSSIRGHLKATHKVEVQGVVKAIAAAQERYRSEHLQYHNTSNGNLAALYPMAAPSAQSYAFYGWSGHSLAGNWELLSPDITTPVRFGYAVVAGLPTTDTSVFPATGLAAQPAWQATRSPWYVVQATGDEDGDSDRAIAFATSFSPVITWQNEFE